MPKYAFNDLSYFRVDDGLGTENITMAHYLMNPDAADHRKDTILALLNMNMTATSKQIDTTEDILIPDINSTRAFYNFTMWSIVQNYAEFKLIEGYNTIPNFCKIIVFFGIP